MPTRKGEKKSEEAIDRIKEGKDKGKIQREKDKTELRKMEANLVKEKYKNGLKDYMEQRLFDFKYELKRINPESRLTLLEIDKLIRGKKAVGGALYSAEELSMLFDYYRDFIAEINTIIRYIPTKKNFCAFAEMSSSTYDTYLIEGDSQRIEIMKMIDDYITDISLTLAQHREIDNVTTMFRSKTEHGMVEATAPIVIKHETDVNLDAIKEQVKALKAGKSLKNIELSPEDYKVENC